MHVSALHLKGISRLSTPGISFERDRSALWCKGLDQFASRFGISPIDKLPHHSLTILMLHLVPVIPQILEDSRRVIHSWGYSGKLDPFERIYEVRMFHTVTL